MFLQLTPYSKMSYWKDKMYVEQPIKKEERMALEKEQKARASN